MKKGIPSVFTSLGLVAGCISVVFSISYGNLTLAGYFIIVAAFFDFVDGFAARLVHHVTEFGKQLDSLADVVSFGLAPAMIIYQLLLLSYVKSSPGANFDVINPSFPEVIILCSAFLIVVFSALRLAKFNLDPGQKKNFRGLAVPANALFIAGLGFAAETSRLPLTSSMIINRVFLLAVVAVSCFLLVSNIGMFSLKFSGYDFRKNMIRYLFLILAALIIAVWWLPGLSLVIIVYVLMSLINNAFVKME
jgi:CDP-diacylglycerol--serine O-phosphatidyltransferase